MGQVADTIKGLEAKLADAQATAKTALEAQQSLTVQLTAAQANQLDDADKAAIAEAQAILNPTPTHTV